MSIGGGLHDDDRPPPNLDQIQMEDEVHAKWREWSFWLCMGIGLWASFQGWPRVAFWFTVVVGVVASLKVLAAPIVGEISRVWNS